ncbi:hypothetical protein PoB_000717200 [Plakobranchus ocellatus]|uniref:Uncharacterized protein n=1 Tax=Plakobranchus ocellatus TaxID=259542 RepID=A0AAV3YDZ0_9GAST|nr:hypothetical protein PoB_000717200 [Plakobranchus ocellatus]
MFSKRVTARRPTADSRGTPQLWMPARGNGKRSLKHRMKDKMKQLQAVRWASRSQPAQSSAHHEQQNGHSLPPGQEGPTASTSTPRVSQSAS